MLYTTVLEYLQEAERVVVAGAWWADGETNTLRTLRQGVF